MTLSYCNSIEMSAEMSEMENDISVFTVDVCFVLLFVHRNKAILFYFNILHCANPAVLINLQCPTTQVSETLCSVISSHDFSFPEKRQHFLKPIERIAKTALPQFVVCTNL